jgi:signal transduction histidine kinase
MSAYLDHEEILARLIHDLSQPLGAIETSAYVLNLVLDPSDARVHEHVDAIERQAAQAGRLLIEATGELRRLRAQRAEVCESLDLTKSETAAVT